MSAVPPRRRALCAARRVYPPARTSAELRRRSKQCLDADGAAPVRACKQIELPHAKCAQLNMSQIARRIRRTVRRTGGRPFLLGRAYLNLKILTYTTSFDVVLPTLVLVVVVGSICISAVHRGAWRDAILLVWL